MPITLDLADKKLTELKQSLQQAIQQAAGRDATCIRLDQQIRDWTEFKQHLADNGKAKETEAEKKQDSGGRHAGN